MTQLGYVPLCNGYTGVTLGRIYWDTGSGSFTDDEDCPRHVWLNATHTRCILIGEDIEINITDDVVDL